MNEAYLVIGGNLGDKLKNIYHAEALIGQLAGSISSRSDIFVTAAWGNTGQPDFYNRALCIRTALSADALLPVLLDIERQLGRVRGEKWSARTMDIDIIFYNHAVMEMPGLHVPHPRMEERRFVLAPLAEIAGSYMHPVLHKTVAQLLDACTDRGEAKPLTFSNA